MNEKFFDLKKEKQDRMINGALEIFAMNGYDHASTDDIVKAAGISKGLLFHYFISKLGLYSFIYDYSVKYVLLELSTVVSGGEEKGDFFDLFWQIRTAQLQVMKTYPYMIQFLNRSRQEDSKEALAETAEKREILPAKYHEIMDRADSSLFNEDTDMEKLSAIIDYTETGLLTGSFQFGSFQPEAYMEELKGYLDMLKRLTYRQEEGQA